MKQRYVGNLDGYRMNTYTTLAQGVRDYFMEEYMLVTDDVEKELLMDKIVFWSMEALNDGSARYVARTTKSVT